MDKICGIYKITSPSGRIYVGQTVNFNHRKTQYSNLDCKTQSKLYNSILKYGWNFHNIELIEECTLEHLNERERYWQDFYNCLKNGLNCVLTTTKTKSGELSNETKEKISEALKGKKQPKISEAKKGTKHSEESKRKMSSSKKKKYLHGEIKPTWLGKKLSEKTRHRMSSSMKGRRITDDVKNKLSEIMLNKSHTKKKVINTETSEIFNSAKEAYRLTDFSYHSFCNMLRGRTINKTKFKYYE
jgi:group I intron endonuclease